MLLSCKNVKACPSRRGMSYSDWLSEALDQVWRRLGVRHRVWAYLGQQPKVAGSLLIL